MGEIISTLIFEIDTRRTLEQLDQLEQKTNNLTEKLATASNSFEQFFRFANRNFPEEPHYSFHQETVQKSDRPANDKGTDLLSKSAPEKANQGTVNSFRWDKLSDRFSDTVARFAELVSRLRLQTDSFSGEQIEQALNNYIFRLSQNIPQQEQIPVPLDRTQTETWNPTVQTRYVSPPEETVPLQKPDNLRRTVMEQIPSLLHEKLGVSPQETSDFPQEISPRQQILPMQTEPPSSPAPAPHAQPREKPLRHVQPRETPLQRVQPRETPFPHVQPRETSLPRVQPRETPLPRVQPREIPFSRVQPSETPLPSVTPGKTPQIATWGERLGQMLKRLTPSVPPDTKQSLAPRELVWQKEPSSHANDSCSTSAELSNESTLQDIRKILEKQTSEMIQHWNTANQYLEKLTQPDEKTFYLDVQDK